MEKDCMRRRESHSRSSMKKNALLLKNREYRQNTGKNRKKQEKTGKNRKKQEKIS